MIPQMDTVETVETEFTVVESASPDAVEVLVRPDTVVTLIPLNELVEGFDKGRKGDPGEDGLSAYEIAVNNGFVGTEVEWLASLQGEDGIQGADGEPGADGTDGAPGANGNDGAPGVAGAPGVEIPPFSVADVVAVRTYTFRLYANRNATITGVRASVGTAPTGAAIIVDVLKNGTTIFTGGVDRPTIAAGTFTDVGVPDVTSLVNGDYLTITIVQVGSIIAGSDLVVQVVTA